MEIKELIGRATELFEQDFSILNKLSKDEVIKTVENVEKITNYQQNQHIKIILLTKLLYCDYNLTKLAEKCDKGVNYISQVLNRKDKDNETGLEHEGLVKRDTNKVYSITKKGIAEVLRVARDELGDKIE